MHWPPPRITRFFTCLYPFADCCCKGHASSCVQPRRARETDFLQWSLPRSKSQFWFLIFVMLLKTFLIPAHRKPSFRNFKLFFKTSNVKIAKPLVSRIVQLKFSIWKRGTIFRLNKILISPTQKTNPFLFFFLKRKPRTENKQSYNSNSRFILFSTIEI